MTRVALIPGRAVCHRFCTALVWRCQEPYCTKADRRVAALNRCPDPTLRKKSVRDRDAKFVRVEGRP